MQEYFIKTVGAPDVSFCGELLATASSENIASKMRGKKNNSRWTVLELYKTEAGAFVCVNIGRSSKPGEVDQAKVEVVETEKAVIDFFGQGWLSKELYETAGIENVIRIK